MSLIISMVSFLSMLWKLSISMLEKFLTKLAVIWFLEKNHLFYLFFKFLGKEGIYLEDHVADNVVDDRFSFRSNDPNNYSPSFYHFRPSKTSVSRPGGSIRKESRSDSPFYKAGNSYTGKKMFLFKFLQQLW